MASAYDDALWRIVPDGDVAPSPHLSRFVSSLREADDALDLGCGDGRLSALIPARALTIADVSGVALERARRRLPGAHAVELDPDAPLPLADNCFDLVVCTETIEHVRDVQTLLSEVRRVLAPGGRLALSTPAHGRGTGLQVLVRGMERRFDPLSPHLRHFSRRSLRRLLGEMGFEPDVRRRSGTLVAVATR